MKKRFILVAALILVLCGAALSPLLLKHHTIQQRVNQRLTSLLGKNASVSELSWRWLPIPALQVKDIHSENNLYSLEIPRMLLFPNWRSLFNRQFNLGKITCLSPRLVIKDLSSPTGSWPSHLPNLAITIKDGELSIPAVSGLPGGVSTKKLLINNIRLDIACRGQRLKVNMRHAAGFSKKITLLAKVDLSKHYYRLDLSGKDINIAELFNKLGHNITPATSSFDAKMHAEGLGRENWQMSISEINAPCPIYLAGKLCQISSLASLKLTKYNHDYFLKLKKLTIPDPALSLSGTIARRQANPTDKPRWEIDLQGKDIDLAAVRSIILDEFGGNPIAKEVCAIVRGGQAKSARYTFNGPATDFKHIHKMKIWVDVNKAPINIPGIGLNLDWASGPITIINGNLAGRGLSAGIDKSLGANGNLFLDLTGTRNAFTLDLDLNADLHNLHDVLQQIVNNQPFQRELAKFKDISGRANGSLHLGDQLHRLETRVTVRDINGQGKYTRLPWGFKITNGNLEIEPGKVRWDHIAGDLGPHKIKQSAGDISWGDNQSRLHINQLKADFDLAALWQNGSLRLNGKKEQLRSFFDRQLSDISGQAELNNFHLSGPANSPAAWRFKGKLAVHDLKLNADNLPGSVSSKDIQAELSDKYVSLAGVFEAAGQSLYLSGRYRHHNLKKWRGKSTFNGIIAGELGRWLKGRAWLPAKFFPRLPCRLRNFTVTNNNSSWTDMRVRGEIIAGRTGTGPALDLDIIHTPRASINNLTLQDDTRKGKLTYIYNSSRAQTVFTWHGDMRAQALASLFQQNFINSGEISGSFNMLSSHRPSLSSSFSGWLKGRKLTIQPGNLQSAGQSTAINSIDISGDKHAIKITNLDVNMGPDTLHGQGQVTTAKDNYQLAMQVTANNLAWHNLRQTIKNVRSKLQTAAAPATTMLKPANRIHHFLPENISGTISFDLGSFTYKEALADNKAASEPRSTTLYSWSPLLGDITFAGQKDAKVELNSGLICGMEMSGVWDLDGPPGKSFFQISQEKPNFLFEKALPCLGVKQSLIEGPFSLDAKLHGLPGNWQSGHLNLQSPKGLIRRMDLLSKIFSVINFTDLLTWDGQADSQHKGLEYNALDIKTNIKDNLLQVDKIVLKGKGVNLTGRGSIDLKDKAHQADLTFFIAPLKMIDSVVTSIPLIGKALGGKKESILTFPVGVKGPIKAPEVTALPPSAIGKAAVEFVLDTLTLPFRIFAPLLPKREPLATDK